MKLIFFFFFQRKKIRFVEGESHEEAAKSDGQETEKKKKNLFSWNCSPGVYPFSPVHLLHTESSCRKTLLGTLQSKSVCLTFSSAGENVASWTFWNRRNYNLCFFLCVGCSFLPENYLQKMMTFCWPGGRPGLRRERGLSVR